MDVLVSFKLSVHEDAAVRIANVHSDFESGS